MFLQEGLPVPVPCGETRQDSNEGTHAMKHLRIRLSQGLSAVMSAALVAALLVVGGSPSTAEAAEADASASDDFERADGPIGSNWVQARGSWAVSSGEAVASANVRESVATHQPLKLGDRYTASADIRIVTSGTPAGMEWSGIAANVYGPDSLDYYVLRVTTAGGERTGQWQLLEMTDNAPSAVLKSGTMNAPYGTPLRLSLTRDGGTFDIRITNTGTGATLVDTSKTLSVADPNRVGGYAGLYSLAGHLRAGSFALTTTTPAVTPPGPVVCDAQQGSYDFSDDNVEVLDTSSLGRTWAGMPVGQPVLTRGNHQYAAYYDLDRRMVVAHRTLGATPSAWTQKILPTSIGWDSHNYVSLGLDRDGMLHVSGNMHNVPLIYFRTTVAGDVNSLVRVNNMVSAETEDSVTYPEFVNRKDGSLVFSYRNGGSGSGVTYFNVYDEASKSWSRLVDEPLFNGNGSADDPSGTWNAYFEGPDLGPDGYFHMLWVWRDTPDAATNSMLTYAKSLDLVHWVDSAGNPLETPFRYGEGDVVDPVPDGGGLLNGNAKFGFDASDRAVISYHKYDGSGRSQVYAARASGGGNWQINQISDWDGRWSFGGLGSLEFTVKMAGSRTLANGDISVNFTCSGEPQSIVIDNALQPIAQVPTPPLPPEITQVRGSYPGLQVNLRQDSAGQSAQGTYYTRWESLAHNKDQPRGEWPAEGSPIEVVLLGTPTGPTSNLVGSGSGKCVDVPGASRTNGTGLIIYACSSAVNQRWAHTAAKEMRVYGTKCMEASGSAGSRVVINSCSGNNDQKWTANANGTLTNVHSGLCLDVNGGGTANNTAVIVWNCHGSSNQIWTRQT